MNEQNARPSRESITCTMALRSQLAGAVSDACSQSNNYVDGDKLCAILDDVRAVDAEIAGHRDSEEEITWKDLRAMLVRSCQVYIKHLEAADAAHDETLRSGTNAGAI